MIRPRARGAERPAGPARYVLPNGIPVIIEEHRASDVVALQLWVQAGARDEGARELGLAHYLEHMLFKGTPTRPGGFVQREVEGVGGRINAGTSWDWTFYHTVLPARQAVAGIQMLADVGINASLEAGQLEAEKQVVLEEMRLNDDNPRRFLVRELFTAAFAGHPYGRPVIGASDVISALDRETLVGFYRRHYMPEAFALVIVGAIDPAEMLRVAGETFGALPRGGGHRLPPPPPPPLRPVRLEFNRPSGQAHLGLAWQAPRLDHADTPALDLLMSVLGRTKASRLVASLRERDNLVNSVSTAFTALEGAGLVTIVAQLEPQNLARTEERILAEIQRVRDRGVTNEELKRAITAAEVEHEFATETAEGRARAYGQAETIWRLDQELIYLDRIRSVTPVQVQAVARRYLDPERYVRVALLPPRS
ncbi:MAG TPA: pitrilysin family protein [Methylomirabilota bacterium]|nr:pitrilysin family protein [Methylomirabilota bacterium]